MSPERLEELLSRLERERQHADSLYNDALTSLDRALQQAPAMPDPPPAYDESQLTAVNASWDILPNGQPTADGSLKGRLRSFVWRLVGPPLEAQRHFNAALVDHLNRNVASHREAQRAMATAIESLRQLSEGLVRFEAELVHYLQTITLYVDTRDRSSAGQAQVLNAGMSALTDDWLKRWESLAAREQRYEARHQPLMRAYQELKDHVGLAREGTLVLKREIERLKSAAGAERAPQAAPGVPDSDSFRDTADSDVESLSYVSFEDRFRGSPDEIRARLADYVPLFDGCHDVLDVGCGRGELLALLAERGIDARGIDVNPAMVDVCRERGLPAEQASALEYLRSLPDAAVGGLVAVQVVEHFDPPYLVKFLETAFHKLRPGAPLLLETLNPACWTAFFDSYIRDITHRWPLHPETLSFLVQASGFQSVDVQFRSPVAYADKLDRVAVPESSPDRQADPTLVNLIEAVNAHAEKLNARLFTFLDYAVVARR